MKKLMLLVLSCFICNLEGNVVKVDTSTGTYQVDPSGSVEQKKPKKDIKKVHSKKIKHSRFKKLKKAK